jgi:hypothetical protein
MLKMKFLGDISDSAYETEKEKVEVLQAKVNDIKREMNLIQEYKREDIQEVIAELDTEKSRIFKNHNKEMEKIQLELMEAKLSYLNKMVEASNKYKELVEPSRKLDSLKIKMGLKNQSYISGSFEALHQYSVANAGYVQVSLSKPEIYDALEYGKKPEELNKIVQDAKKKGKIED